VTIEERAMERKRHSQKNKGQEKWKGGKKINE
jgi:hypothetical protein